MSHDDGLAAIQAHFAATQVAIARLEGPDIDADHAVALEREAVAKWLDDAADQLAGEGFPLLSETHREIAADVRAGAHWDGA